MVVDGPPNNPQPETPVTTKCRACDGSGLDQSHGAALYYAYSGKLTHCDDCWGTGRAS